MSVLDRFIDRKKGTKERPLSNYEKQLIAIDKERKQKTSKASFSCLSLRAFTCLFIR